MGEVFAGAPARQTFAALDRDNTDEVTVRSLVMGVARLMPRPVEEETWRLLFPVADVDGDGALSYEECLRLVCAGGRGGMRGSAGAFTR